MITFPNAKINIGLDVLNKREDGYHNIDSLFYPIPLNDALEILPTEGDLVFTSSGIELSCTDDNNLVVKAFRLLQVDFDLPNVMIHLRKNIPFGAGLGGGSADAAFALMMLNDMFELGLSEERLIQYSVQIGADCAFFIKNTPCFASGIGDRLTEFDLALKGKFLLMIKPDIDVPTPSAYKYVTPRFPNISLRDLLRLPIEEWSSKVKNDFEESVFSQFPTLLEIKDSIVSMGALYASMSGSGSTIYGIFDAEPEIPLELQSYFCFLSQL